MMITPFFKERYNIRPLTEQAAKAMGHVAYITAQKPEEAIEQMVQAVRQEPVNFALWANADESLSAEFKNTIKTWRPRSVLPPKEPSRHEWQTTASNACLDIKSYFNRYAFGAHLNDIDVKAYSVLCLHAQDRISNIDLVLDAQDYQVQVRSQDISSVHNTAHTDGEYKGLDRFIESLESPTTLIVANDDTYYGQPGREYEFYLRKLLGMKDKDKIEYYMERNNWFLKPDRNITFWQCPKNSLALITNESLPWQPIMHAAPMARDSNMPEDRTVLTYDCLDSRRFPLI